MEKPAEKTVAELINEASKKAEQGNWLPARGATEVEFEIPKKQLAALQAIALKKGITVEKLIIDTVEKYLKDKENE